MRCGLATAELDEGGRCVDKNGVISSYRVAEYISRTGDGAPLCWPLFPELTDGRIAFSTPYAMPTKARNARQDPRVAVLFSDPTASPGSDADPMVLLQGRAEVLDSDWQLNADRYVDQVLRCGFGPASSRILLRTPGLRQVAVGYLTRTWIEIQPEHTLSWARSGPIPAGLRAVRPEGYRPGKPIDVPAPIGEWARRYPRSPVLAFIAPNGYPAAVRSRAEVRRNRIAFGERVPAEPGAPACLTFHKVRGNHRSSSAFMIRGHFDDTGRLVPERIVGNSGTGRDRLTGTPELFRQVLIMGRKLRVQASRQGRPVPRIRRVHFPPSRDSVGRA